MFKIPLLSNKVKRKPLISFNWVLILIVLLSSANLSFLNLRSDSLAQEESNVEPSESQESVLPTVEIPSETINPPSDSQEALPDQDVKETLLESEVGVQEEILNPIDESTPASDEEVNSLSEESVTPSVPLNCQAILQVKEPWKVSQIKEWTGFEEEAEKNNGEIYYQLSLNSGTEWIYYDGDTWRPIDSDRDYNTASVIDKNIKTLPLSDAEVLFKAFFINDCKDQIRLKSLKLNYEQGDSDTGFNLTTSNENISFTDMNGESLTSTLDNFYLYYQKTPFALIETLDDFSADDYRLGASNGKFWFNIDEVSGKKIKDIELIMPRLPDDHHLIICPGASKEEDIIEGCAGEVILDRENFSIKDYELTKLTDPDFWHVKLSSGIFSGGIQIIKRELVSIDNLAKY